MLLLPQGSGARAGARSRASSFPSSCCFFHLSLPYTDSCDKKSQPSLLNHNFCGVSSLRVSEKLLPRTKLCREERRLPSQGPSAWQPRRTRVKGAGASTSPAFAQPHGVHFCASRSPGELKQENCRNRHVVLAPADWEKKKNKGKKEEIKVF